MDVEASDLLGLGLRDLLDLELMFDSYSRDDEFLGMIKQFT